MASGGNTGVGYLILGKPRYLRGAKFLPGSREGFQDRADSCGMKCYRPCRRAVSNSSSDCQPCNSGRRAASRPSRKPNRVIVAKPVKSISGLYSSLGW